MRGEAGVLRGEEGFGELVLVREMREERLGGGVWLRGGGEKGRGVVGLSLCDVGLVQVAQVDRMWGRTLSEVRVQSLRLRGEGGTGEGIRGEDWRPVGEVGMRHEGREGRRKHLREVRWGEVLWCVLLHVESLSGGVLQRVQVHTSPGVRAGAVSPHVGCCPRVRRRSASRFRLRVCPCVRSGAVRL